MTLFWHAISSYNSQLLAAQCSVTPGAHSQEHSRKCARTRACVYVGAWSGDVTMHGDLALTQPQQGHFGPWSYAGPAEMRTVSSR